MVLEGNLSTNDCEFGSNLSNTIMVRRKFSFGVKSLSPKTLLVEGCDSAEKGKRCQVCENASRGWGHSKDFIEADVQ